MIYYLRIPDIRQFYGIFQQNGRKNKIPAVHDAYYATFQAFRQRQVGI